MNAKELVKELIDTSAGWTQNRMGKRLGLSQQTMSKRMNANDLKVGFVVQILDALNYRLVAVPPEADLPQGSKVLSPPEKIISDEK